MTQYSFEDVIRTKKEKGCSVGDKNGMFGKNHSCSSKQKMSINLKKTWTPKRRKHWGKRQVGKNNHMYGKEYPKSAKQKISEIKKKNYIAISPKKETHYVHGLFEFCKQNNLSRKMMQSYIDKGVISLSKHGRKTIMSKNTFGWEIKSCL